jgi:hypothetical protein
MVVDIAAKIGLAKPRGSDNQATTTRRDRKLEVGS